MLLSKLFKNSHGLGERITSLTNTDVKDKLFNADLFALVLITSKIIEEIEKN